MPPSSLVGRSVVSAAQDLMIERPKLAINFNVQRTASCTFIQGGYNMEPISDHVKGLSIAVVLVVKAACNHIWHHFILNVCEHVIHLASRLSILILVRPECQEGLAVLGLLSCPIVLAFLEILDLLSGPIVLEVLEVLQHCPCHPLGRGHDMTHRSVLIIYDQQFFIYDHH